MDNRFIVVIVDDSDNNVNTYKGTIRSMFDPKYLEIMPVYAYLRGGGEQRVTYLLNDHPLYDIYFIDIALEGTQDVVGLKLFADLWARSIREGRRIWVIIYSQQPDPRSVLGPAFGRRNDLPLHFEEKMPDSGDNDSRPFDPSLLLRDKLKSVWKAHAATGLSLAHQARNLVNALTMTGRQLLEWMEEQPVFVPEKGRMSLACYFPDLATSLLNSPDSEKESGAVHTELLRRMTSSSLWVWYESFFRYSLPEWRGKQIGDELTHPGHTVASADYEAALNAARSVDAYLADSLKNHVVDVAPISGNNICIPNTKAADEKCTQFKDAWRLELIRELLHPYNGTVLQPIQKSGKITICYSEKAEQARKSCLSDTALRKLSLPYRLYCNVENVKTGLSVLSRWITLESGATQVCVDLAVTPVPETHTVEVQVSYQDNGHGIESPESTLHATAGHGGDVEELSRLCGYCGLIVETVSASGYVWHDFWTGETRTDSSKKGEPPYTKFVLDFVLPFRPPSSSEVQNEQ